MKNEAPGSPYRKIAARIIPLMMLLYLMAFLDRVNIGFAALTMNQDLGFTPSIYGWGAGIFFIGYFFFEIPSNLILEKVGARLWIARIMITWGLISAGMAFVSGTWSFLALRFLLGVAEAGFLPGMLLYLTYWFPARHRAKFIALFMAAVPLASAIGSPISGLLVSMDEWLGLKGWQWLFLLEGLPSCLLGVVVLHALPEGPARAKWLTASERAFVEADLANDRRNAAPNAHCPRSPRRWATRTPRSALSWPCLMPLRRRPCWPGAGTATGGGSACCMSLRQLPSAVLGFSAAFTSAHPGWRC